MASVNRPANSCKNPPCGCTIAPPCCAPHPINMENTYQVPEANLDTLKRRLEKIARRCRRIKVAEPVLTVGQPTDHEYTVRNQFGEDVKRIRLIFPVTLNSPERPKIEGYEFAAVISPVTDEDGKHLGNILRMVPGFAGTLPERFRQASNLCEHCNTDRRRLETFVIANSDGFKQVGRNCLANYLGLTNPHMLAELAELLIDAHDLMSMSEDADGFGCLSGAQERVSVEDVLQVAASAIRQYGWLSNKSAREFEKQSTSQRVSEWIFGGPKTRENFEHALKVSEEDKTLATETESWLETLAGNAQENDYLYNLSLLAQASSVTAKNFGILISAINAYSREKERAIRRNARVQEDSKSDFIGTVGERITIENATVIYTTTFESDYGVTHLFKFKAGDNVLVYFASNPMFEQGEVIPSMIARVKAHENRVDKYNAQGVRQTIITRASLPKPPKPELTPEQKTAKKAIAKLRKVQRLFPTIAELRDKSPVARCWANGDKFEYSDYQAWGTLGELIWTIQREAGI